MTQTESAPAWPSRKRRASAFIIDFMIIGAVTFGMGLAAFDLLSASPLLGRAVGFVAGVLYFGILSSRLGGSATVGMRILRLRVARTAGGDLSLGRSFARAALLVAPIVANGMFLNLDASSFVTILLSIVMVMLVFGVGLAQLYLLVFARRTGRLLHDIVFDTMVVRTEAQGVDLAAAGSARRIAIGIVAASGAVGAGVAIAGPSLLPAGVERLNPSIKAVQALPEVVSAGAMDQTTSWTSTHGGEGVVHAVIITAKLRQWPKDPQAEIARIGAIASSTYRLAPGQVLRIELVQGFETGFSSASHKQSNAYTTGG